MQTYDSCKELDDGVILNNQLKLCKECRSYDSNKLMSKSAAKLEYLLTDKDFASLKSAQCKNSYNRSIMTNLYLVTDLKRAATKKHGGLKKLKAIKKEREKKRLKKKKLAIELRQFRRKELNDHLVSIGVGGIRPDSVLCQNYLDQGDRCGYTIKQIGDILLEMGFYYKHTDYHSILLNLRQKDRRYNHRGYYDEYDGWDSGGSGTSIPVVK